MIEIFCLEAVSKPSIRWIETPSNGR